MRQKQKTVTLKDIAQSRGVSVMAVSLALRGRSSEVSKERMSTILNMAWKLNYDVAEIKICTGEEPDSSIFSIPWHCTRVNSAGCRHPFQAWCGCHIRLLSSRSDPAVS